MGDRKDPAQLLGLVAPASHPPVGDIHRLAIVGDGQVERAEVVDFAGSTKSISSSTLNVEPVGLEAERMHLLLPHSAQKPRPRYFSGQASSL